VDGGDYRFFSTEYAPEDLKVVNTEGGKAGRLREVKPMRLDGLSLTNMNNNRGQKPITNRGNAETLKAETLKSEKEFRHGLEPAAVSQTKQQKEITRMKTVATRLGLAADASEEAVFAEVSKIQNRATEAEAKVVPLTQRVTALETENATLLNEQLDADFATAGIKEENIINRHKPLLSDPKHFQNREQRILFIGDLARNKNAPAPQTKLQNRDGKAPPAGAGTEYDEGRVKKAEAAVQDYRIKNRCSYNDARNTVRRLNPELFEGKS
jgi:hypothetical protein